MNSADSCIAAEIAAILAEAKSMSYTARSVLAVARHRVALAADRKPRQPTGAVTRLYLDALDGKVGGGIAAVKLRQMVERLEPLLRGEEGEAAERPVLVGATPEGDDILLGGDIAPTDGRELKRCVRAMDLTDRAERMVEALTVLERSAGDRVRRLAEAPGIAGKADEFLDLATGWKVYFADLQRWRRRLERARRFEAACRRTLNTVLKAERSPPPIGEAPGAVGEGISPAFVEQMALKRVQGRQARLAPMQAYKKRTLTAELRAELGLPITPSAAWAGVGSDEGREPPGPI